MEIIKLILLGFLLPVFAVLTTALWLLAFIVVFIKDKIESIYYELYKDFIT